MIVTPTIRDLIVDGDRMAEIKDYIAEGREQYGMQTFDQHLKELVASGDVSYEVAHANASNPSDFDLQMRTFGGMSKTKAPNGAPAQSGAAPAAPADVFGGGLDFLNS
jgi:twitching motility protein PilT